LTNLLLTFSFQIIPFYKSPADILWLAGDDDHNFDSALYARLAAELVRIKKKMCFRQNSSEVAYLLRPIVERTEYDKCQNN
jgi:hypothetical protein